MRLASWLARSMRKGQSRRDLTAGCGAPQYGVTLMSSNEYRSVDDLLPQFQSTPGKDEVPGKTTARIGLVAVSNAGHCIAAALPSGGRCQVAAGLAFSHRSGQPAGQSHPM